MEFGKFHLHSACTSLTFFRHTSIVVYGKEIFFGQGICITRPGKSHHGQPLQIFDLGETGIDQDTFNEYLEEMREQYTADKVRCAMTLH
jgi:hypothetical protein